MNCSSQCSEPGHLLQNIPNKSYYHGKNKCINYQQCQDLIHQTSVLGNSLTFCAQTGFRRNIFLCDSNSI